MSIKFCWSTALRICPGGGGHTARDSGVVVAEAVWPPKSKLFPFQPFVENGADPWSKPIMIILLPFSQPFLWLAVATCYHSFQRTKQKSAGEICIKALLF